LISDALPFGLLWYENVDAAIGYAFYSRATAAELREPCYRWHRHPSSSQHSARLSESLVVA